MTTTDLRTQELADGQFAAIVATMHERPRCADTNRDDTQCRRAASWHVDIHGCDRKLMCTQHLNAGLRHIERCAPNIHCKHCDGYFTTVEATVTARRL